MSESPFSPAKLIAPFLTVACIAALHFFAVPLAAQPVLKGVLLFLLAAAAIQTGDNWVIRPLVARFGMPQLFHTIIKVLVAFVVCFTMLRSLYDIDLMPLLTTSAVLSFVLGLALQDTLSNLFAGITINIEHPYRVGDWISTGGIDGKVVEINWRTTKLLTNDNNFLIVPNNNISKETIVNYSVPEPVSGLWVDVDLDYEVPPNRAREVILEALRCMPNLPRVREPNVFVRGFAESSITYGVRVWLDDWSKKTVTASDIRTHLWYALKRANMSIPFPVRNMVITRPQPPKRTREEEAMELLEGSPFFANQPVELLRELAAVLEKRDYAHQSHIFHEGDKGESLYIVAAGNVSIIKEGHTIAELGKGALFGEMSLLTGANRSASVLAGGNCVCLELSKAEFARVAAGHPKLLEDISSIITERQLAGREVLEKAKAEAQAQGGDTHAVFKTKMLSLMRSFLGIRPARKP